MQMQTTSINSGRDRDERRTAKRANARPSMRARAVAALPSSEHSLRLWTGAMMWLSMTAAIIGLSFIPSLTPENANFWRVSLGGAALFFVLLHIPAGKYLTTRQSYIATVVGAYLGTAVFIILFQITPAIWALLTALMVPAIFVGYFLRLKELLPLLIFVTAVALSSLASPFAAETAHLESRLAAYLTALWAMMFALHLQKQDLLRAVQEVSRKTFTDPLTGLANHRALQGRARALLANSGRGPGTETALLMIDLDNFKQANSLYGHLGGDLTLSCVADQIQRVMPENAMAARIGGDEFAVLVRSGSPDELDEMAGLLRGAVRGSKSEMPLEGIDIDASIGYAIAPRDGETLAQLTAAADDAMYKEKSTHSRPEGIPTPESDADERRAAAAKAKIAWQDRESSTSHLRFADSPGAGYFRSRSDIALFTFFGFMVSSLALAVSFAVPGADNDYLVAAYAALVVGPAFAIAVLLWNPRNHRVPHLIIDVFAIACLLIIAALSGGQASPAAPLIYLLVIHQAWFWERSVPLWRLATLPIVILAPIAYQGFTAEGSVAGSAAAFYSAIGTGLILALSLYLNQLSTAQASAHAKQLAQTDPLTGIPNRRAFNEFIERQLDDARQVEEFAIVMIDLDNFKEVNTDHGHQAGDQLLKSIADALEEASREGDCVARVGGDEFAAVLPGAGVDGARALAERFVAAVEECAKQSGDSASAAVTASAGFALHPLHGDSLDELVRTADDALMAVKGSAKGTARVGRLVNAV